MKNIVIVEDNSETRQFLETILDEINITSNIFSSVSAALDYLKSNIPDIIITDLVMPGEDGFYFIREIRKDMKLDKTIVGVLSALSLPEVENEARKLGVNFFIKKPFRVKEFLEKINSYYN